MSFQLRISIINGLNDRIKDVIFASVKTQKEGKGREDKNVVMKDVFIVQSRRVLVDSVHKNTEQSLLEMRLCNGCYSSMGVYKCLVFKINDKAEDAKAQWQRFSSFFSSSQ